MLDGLMNFSIDVSIECLSLFLRIIIAGRLESILAYFFQCKSLFKWEDEERNVLEISRRNGF